MEFSSIDPDGLGLDSALAYCMDQSLGQPLLTDYRFNPLHPSFFADIVSRIPNDITEDDTPTPIPSCHPDLALEKWEVGEEEIRFIAEASRSFSKDDVETPIKQAFLQSLSSQPWKLELPLLTFASQEESCEMFCRLAAAPPVSLEFHEIPMDDLNEDEGDGVGFPSSVHSYQQTLESELQEKLEVTKEAIAYLANIIRADRSDLGDVLVINDLMPSARLSTQNLRLTPPATPRFIHMQSDPWIPGSDGAEVPSPSEPGSLLSDDLKAIETHIFETDNGPLLQEMLVTDRSPLKDILPASTPEGDLAIPILEHPKIDDYKLELPLIARNIDEPSEMKLVVDDMGPFLIDKDIENKDPVNITALLEIDISSQLQEAAEKVSRSAEQEQLEPLDGLARLTVPVVDNTAPEADWSEIIKEEKHMLAHIIQRDSEEFRLSKWKVDKRAERDLPWIMSTSSGVVLADDNLEEVDESSLQEFCGFDDDVLGISALARQIKDLAKHRGTNDLDDDDLEPVFARTPTPTPATDLPMPENPEDLMSCIRKKRKALADLESSTFTKRTKYKPPVDGEDTLLMGDQFPEGMKLLTSFLELNGHHKAASRQSKHFRAKADHRASSVICHAKQSGNKPEGNSSTKGSATLPAQNPQQHKADISKDVPNIIAKPAPVPGIELPDFPLKLVISISLPRCLVRHLETLLPGVELIERDYSAYNYSTWAAGTSAPSTVMSSLVEEADIIVSSGVGIVLTATVNVRQAPLIACGGDNILQRQVRKVCRRYERLVILVSDKSLDDTILPMATADELAFAEFQAFTRGLQDISGISVYWVGGGQASLARWIASLASQCASLDIAPFYRLLSQGESHWELFLRRAGMNTFAAQIVCGLLQNPYGTEADSMFGGSGLAAFVSMSAQERVRRYACVFGGRRVLDRVSEMVDQNWG